ncbi:MAG TPA: methyltransferase domain-containing protein [Chromatiales bacterium]|nr:methyltransferase domain-containing protein [Chromatiales bacterium]
MTACDALSASPQTGRGRGETVQGQTGVPQPGHVDFAARSAPAASRAVSARPPCAGIGASEIARGLAAWYRTPAGRALRVQLQQVLDTLLEGVFGYYGVLVGWGAMDSRLLEASPIKRRFVLGPTRGTNGVLAVPEALPLQRDAIDLVVLFHALEYSPRPHAVLREVDRILIPEGHVVVVGFNPWSRFGLWRITRRQRAPWCGTFYSSARIRDWIALLGFELKSVHVAAPRGHALHGLDRRFPLPLFGPVHVHHAIKRVATLTPLRAAWPGTAALLPGKAPEPTLSQPKAARQARASGPRPASPTSLRS